MSIGYYNINVCDDCNKEKFCWIGDGEVGRLKTINRKLRYWKLDCKGEKQFYLKNIITLGVHIQLRLTLCDPMDWSLTGSFSLIGSFVHISQARILKFIAISFSRGSSWPRDQNCAISNVSYIDKWIFYHWDIFIYLTVLGLI